MAAINLPIGVVIPALNAREALEEHLAHAQSWLGLVREVVVVDSYSTDGTFEYLQKNLRHPNLRLLRHPRGLYQSWNYGIQQLTSEFTYISTIRDVIQTEGLVHLSQILSEFGTDLVISPPELVDAQGRLITDESWPVHRLLAACPLHRPCKLDQFQAFLLDGLESPCTLLGSSASNLYRTATLQRLPFPTEYAHAGDSAWALRCAWDVQRVITPRAFSRFTMHPNANTGMDQQVFQALIARFDDLVRRTAAQCPEPPSGSCWTVEFVREILELPALHHVLWQRQACYNQARRSRSLWFLNPEVWQARAARNQCRAELLSRSRRCAQDCAALQSRSAPVESSFEASVNRYLFERIRNFPNV